MPELTLDHVLIAVTDLEVHRCLVAGGLGTEDASSLVTDVVTSWLRRRNRPGERPGTRKDTR